MSVIEPDPLLGQALAHFPSDRLRPLIVAGSVIAPVALALGLTTAQVVEWWGPVLTVIVMAAVALALGWYVLHVWNREIILYERGFSYREGSDTVFIPYDEIASIRQRAERLAYFGGLLRRNVYRFTVTTTEAERFTITNLYRRADELGTRLAERANRVLGPQVTRRLADGSAVPFGDTLSVSAEGLRENGRDLLWADFGGYRLGGSKLALLDSSGNDWYTLPLSEVDNIPLLLELFRWHQTSANPQKPGLTPLNPPS
ncbi:MAG: DUF6585 family protein [Chloroflexota bacterium]